MPPRRQGLQVARQDDFGPGIYRGREAPEFAVYDAVNCLIDDEGQLFRRGGSEYKSDANAGGTLVGLADVYVNGDQLTMMWSTTTAYYIDPSDDESPASLGTDQPKAFARGVVIQDAGSGTETWIAPGPGGTGAELVSADVGGSAYLAGLPTYLENVTAVAAVGTPPRMLLTYRSRAYFSPPGDPTGLTDTDYHEIPGAAQMIGADSVGDTAVLFTTAGVYVIANMSLDPLDDYGNQQHTVAQVNELILWEDPGIAKYKGAFVVPAVDNVWLMVMDAPPLPIGDAIRPLYLSYVKAGYGLGTATVHRGHYFLPIVNGTTWVDTLVCRLDRGFAWTRWSGHGAGVAYAQRIGSSTRTPKLLSVAGERVTELTGAWSPAASNASEADATTHSLSIETRDIPTPGGREGSTTMKLRVRYEATGTATITAAFSRGPEGTAYTALTNVKGGSTSDGLDMSVWSVVKKAPAIRFKIASSTALSTFTLRSLETHYRGSGKP